MGWPWPARLCGDEAAGLEEPSPWPGPGPAPGSSPSPSVKRASPRRPASGRSIPSPLAGGPRLPRPRPSPGATSRKSLQSTRRTTQGEEGAPGPRTRLPPPVVGRHHVHAADEVGPELLQVLRLGQLPGHAGDHHLLHGCSLCREGRAGVSCCPALPLPRRQPQWRSIRSGSRSSEGLATQDPHGQPLRPRGSCLPARRLGHRPWSGVSPPRPSCPGPALQHLAGCCHPLWGCKVGGPVLRRAQTLPRKAPSRRVVSLLREPSRQRKKGKHGGGKEGPGPGRLWTQRPPLPSTLGPRLGCYGCQGLVGLWGESGPCPMVDRLRQYGFPGRLGPGQPLLVRCQESPTWTHTPAQVRP